MPATRHGKERRETTVVQERKELVARSLPINLQIGYCKSLVKRGPNETDVQQLAGSAACTIGTDHPSVVAPFHAAVALLDDDRTFAWIRTQARKGPSPFDMDTIFREALDENFFDIILRDHQ